MPEDNLAKLEVSENHETRNEIVADRVEQILLRAGGKADARRVELMDVFLEQLGI